MYNFADIGLLALGLVALVVLAVIKRAVGLVHRSFRQHSKQEE